MNAGAGWSTRRHPLFDWIDERGTESLMTLGREQQHRQTWAEHSRNVVPISMVKGRCPLLEDSAQRIIPSEHSGGLRPAWRRPLLCFAGLAGEGGVVVNPTQFWDVTLWVTNTPQVFNRASSVLRLGRSLPVVLHKRDLHENPMRSEARARTCFQQQHMFAACPHLGTRMSSTEARTAEDLSTFNTCVKHLQELRPIAAWPRCNEAFYQEESRAPNDTLANSRKRGSIIGGKKGAQLAVMLVLMKNSATTSRQHPDTKAGCVLGRDVQVLSRRSRAPTACALPRPPAPARHVG
ncbi:hypothetical protein GGS20DRAFT_581440 [Poronia punctata]|nr:hypothetical protein GGS20DRAFT_581440 [Poronia punctata]